MWYVRRAAAFLCLALLAPGLALAQAPEGLKDTRSFFQDVGGYHAQGTAEAPERGEAQRLAKAAALRHLFTEIGKDMIFAEMCISGWPEYISVEDSVSVERDELHVVQVQVVVATSAIMLTEQKYQIAVTELLNAMERSMAEVEKDLAEADGLERNLKVAEALGAYRRARTGAGGVRELVRDVGDKSVLSESGNNIAALSTRLDALSLRISGGLDRMEAIEREAQQSAAADEMTKAYELYDQELLAMESRGEEYLALSPFYDLPRTRLDGILIDLQADRAKGAQVSAELERLRGTIPQDREYLGQKIDLSLADAAALAKRLEKMEEEVRLEIKTPRLVRQERAQRRKAALAAVGRGASYAFLHKPRDIATFEWKLPLVWDMEKAVRATGGADVRLEVEGAFPGGLWIRGSLGHDDVTDIADPLSPLGHPSPSHDPDSPRQFLSLPQ